MIDFSQILPNGRKYDEYYAPYLPNTFAPDPNSQILDVAIVGAGIAGLSAAIGLLQAGHNVELYERSEFTMEIGAAINVCPNASRLLSYYEFDFNRAKPVVVEETNFADGHTFELLQRADTPDMVARYGSPWFLFHRVDLHKELMRLVSKPRSHTTATAKINLLSEIVDMDLEGGLTLADGTRLKKDLVVVADGIRTKFASSVVGPDEAIQAKPTGTAIYRFLVPTQKLLDDPQTRYIYERRKCSMYIARYGDVRLVWYPCRAGTLQNFGLFHPDRLQGYNDEVYNIPASEEGFAEAYKDLHRDLQAICKKAEDLKLWRLCERNKPIPRLTKGKVVLVGDAAHPMLPHQGQGGGMAIEDGAALGVLFSSLRSTDEIEERLALFDRLRLDRVSAMQIFSSVGQDEAEKIKDLAKPYVKGNLPGNSKEYRDFNFTPNILRDADEMLREFLRTKEDVADQAKL